MDKSRTATNKSAAVSSCDSSRSHDHRFSSGSDLWPEVAPEESSRRAIHRKKSLSTLRDQLLYLQALFPYAPYDELMSIINTTDGPDEAAQHAYEALNPNYTGFLYLKEQTDVMNNTKSTKAQRATAFNGLKEALEERATDAFRPGMFSNLSQLQEYHETVGLFALDTTEWDRAMLLPARDLAEMAFMDLPLREEPSPSSSSDRDVYDCCGNNSARVTRGRGHRDRPHLLSLALNGSNARFMDSSFMRSSTNGFDTTLLSPQAPAPPEAAPSSAPREKCGHKRRDGCKTPVASPDTRESAQQQQRQLDAPKDTGVLYLQESDPEFKAPIIAWAPQAIRVGPAEALRQQEGALRVFDEATFFTDPLLARAPCSILLQTTDKRPTHPPNMGTTSSAASAAHTKQESRQGPVTAGAETDLAALVFTSPSSTPRVNRECHEPVDSATDSLPVIVDEDNEHNQEQRDGPHIEEEEGKCEEVEDDEDDQLNGKEAHSTVVEDGDEEEKSWSIKNAETVDKSRYSNTGDYPAINVVCHLGLLGLHDTRSTSHLSESGRKMDGKEGADGGISGRRTAAEQLPGFATHNHSNTSTHLVIHGSLRETTLETLKSRKRRPLTSSEKVRQRMCKLKPVGNLVFRDSAESPPMVVSSNHSVQTFNSNDGHQTPAGSHSTRVTVVTSTDIATRGGGGNALENTLHTEDDIFTNPSGGTQQQAEWTTRDSRLNNDELMALLPGNGSHIFGSAAASGVQAAKSSTSVIVPTTDTHGCICRQVMSIPAAHPGCSSLDPAAYLNAEEERWSCIVEVLKPFEDIFGAKFRCELVRCVYDDCKAIRTRLTEIFQRLLHVVSQAVMGKTIADGLAEEPMDLPFFGSVLLSTSSVKLQELTFREQKCQLLFCEEGTRLRVKLNVKRMKLEPIQFAYIGEADAARQNRAAQHSQQKSPQPHSRAAGWTLRRKNPEKYKNGITRGTATISAVNMKLKGIVYIWLMASGKVFVTFQEAKVSMGSFTVSTDVPKLNVLFTLGSPIVKMFVERMLLNIVKGVHVF